MCVQQFQVHFGIKFHLSLILQMDEAFDFSARLADKENGDSTWGPKYGLLFQLLHIRRSDLTFCSSGSCQVTVNFYSL